MIPTTTGWASWEPAPATKSPGHAMPPRAAVWKKSTAQRSHRGVSVISNARSSGASAPSFRARPHADMADDADGRLSPAVELDTHLARYAMSQQVFNGPARSARAAEAARAGSSPPAVV